MFPVPSEYGFDLLDVIVRHRFESGPGSLEVKAGDYEMFSTRNSSHVITSATLLLPGTEITMAILIDQPITTMTDEICPKNRCQSNQTSIAPGGGRIW